MFLLLIVRISNESGKEKLILLFISKDFRKSESSSCKSSISSGGRILSFRGFILMFCMTKKERERKNAAIYTTIGSELRKPGENSSVVLVAASQRKLPLIIFCARCVVRWCSLVFYIGKHSFTIMPATEELLKSTNGNSR